MGLKSSSVSCTPHPQQIIIRNSLRRFEELKRRYAKERNAAAQTKDTLHHLRAQLTDLHVSRRWFQEAYAQEQLDRQKSNMDKAYWHAKAQKRQTKLLILTSGIVATSLFFYVR